MDASDFQEHSSRRGVKRKAVDVNIGGNSLAEKAVKESSEGNFLGEKAVVVNTGGNTSGEKVVAVNTGGNSLEEKFLGEKSGTHSSEENGGSSAQGSHFQFSSELSLETIRQKQMKFITERNWFRFHTPRNVLLAMVGEVGELSEIFQWKGELKEGVPEFSTGERAHLGQELSDVLIYLIDLAHACQIDLPKAVIDKFEMNAVKYPAGAEKKAKFE